MSGALPYARDFSLPAVCGRAGAVNRCGFSGSEALWFLRPRETHGRGAWEFRIHPFGGRSGNF